MSASLPEPLKALVEQLSRLPGLGSKSALRLTMALLKWPESETRRLGSTIESLRDVICLCQRCGGISSTSPCPICGDPRRDPKILCVIPEWDSLIALEAGGFYDGLYFVLGGLLLPQQSSQSLDIDRLMERLREGEVKELILALGATLESENTASYINQIVKKEFPELKVSRLAQGLPLGAEVKYMDQETLRQSLRFRQEL